MTEQMIESGMHKVEVCPILIVDCLSRVTPCKLDTEIFIEKFPICCEEGTRIFMVKLEVCPGRSEEEG